FMNIGKIVDGYRHWHYSCGACAGERQRECNGVTGIKLPSRGKSMAELRNIDLNLLVIFQHLLEERNISAVARRLDLSQPAVSNAVRRLRTVLGDELLVRTAQGTQPTPQAERLGGPVGEALALLSHTLDATQDFHAASSQRRFRIAMSDVGEIHFMPQL